MQATKLIVLTGPSGVGKGTLVRSLLQRHPDLQLSVSATTRAPRPGEVHGQDYWFLARAEFKAAIAAGELLEWAEYAGNYYGTPRQMVSEQFAAGKSVLLEIELAGARQVRAQYDAEIVSIFLLPPSLDELERRLRDRGKDSETAIAKRLARAREEVAAQHEFDWQIINDDLETALQQLETAIYGATSCATADPMSPSA
ncbi:guanylate kinase [Rubidibacter lacunae KORDI 51-2]|uniref:Guanylate kinase n=1 Tax=Rubidibacter lacunae KORDI 51-2 TaxID=582515 RepID=U5DG33_9CHRO|nr:guanylate kinase [Rubidibacter lacunae]ERN40222.1 guanylate kinase [Rubidibacter lacunae KORDI 51-2]